jgi:hypothetical protein
MEMDDDGEPIGRGQLDRRAAKARAFRGALFAIALLTGILLVNGIFAILLIEFFQAIGWWEVSAAEGIHGTAAGASGPSARPLALAT